MPKIDYNYLFSRQSLRSLPYTPQKSYFVGTPYSLGMTQNIKKLGTPQKGYFVGIP